MKEEKIKILQAICATDKLKSDSTQEGFSE